MSILIPRRCNYPAATLFKRQSAQRTAALRFYSPTEFSLLSSERSFSYKPRASVITLIHAFPPFFPAFRVPNARNPARRMRTKIRWSVSFIEVNLICSRSVACHARSSACENDSSIVTHVAREYRSIAVVPLDDDLLCFLYEGARGNDRHVAWSSGLSGEAEVVVNETAPLRGRFAKIVGRSGGERHGRRSVGIFAPFNGAHLVHSTNYST